MTIDFLFLNGNPVVTDINYGMKPDGERQRYPGRWNEKIEWTEGESSPMEAEAKAFLARVRTGQRSELLPDPISVELTP